MQRQDIGKIIISGTGTHMGKQMIGSIIIGIISLTINIFLLAWLGEERARLGFWAREQQETLGIIMAIVVVILIVELVWISLKYWQAYTGRNTNISVHENLITGKFATGFMGFEVKNIDLFYDTIVNVDIIRNGIAIHTQGIKYICYVKNGEEIRNEIMTMRKR